MKGQIDEDSFTFEEDSLISDTNDNSSTDYEIATHVTDDDKKKHKKIIDEIEAFSNETVQNCMKWLPNQDVLRLITLPINLGEEQIILFTNSNGAYLGFKYDFGTDYSQINLTYVWDDQLDCFYKYTLDKTLSVISFLEYDKICSYAIMNRIKNMVNAKLDYIDRAKIIVPYKTIASFDTLDCIGQAYLRKYKKNLQTSF